MRRVLLITESLGPGGAERQLCGLAIMLANSAYSCRIITYHENQFYEPIIHNTGVEYEFLPDIAKKRTRILKVANYVRKYKPDIVISYLMSVNQTMCLAKLFYKARLIVSERNNDICNCLKTKVKFNLYRMADAIVPNSNCQSEFIRKNFSFLSSKVYPIINYVDVNKFTPAESQIQSEPLRVVTVARYTHQKNVLVFIRAVRKIKDLGLKVHFDWYGDKTQNPSYFAEVKDLYERLKIEDYLTLHDSRSKIEDVYSNANIFCLPSLYEGYPNVVIEAMSSGLPILCSRVFENPYIVEDGKCGYLFDPKSVDEIVNSIKKMIALSSEERIEIGKRNRSLCLMRNTEGIFLKSYMELIERLL